jgi:small subunit ribosomal protein S16
LARTGAKKKSSYRVVVIDRERARDGRFVEIVGHYNPRLTPPEIVLKRERVDYWIAKGAQPSETVQSFLKAPAAAPASAA